MLGTTTSEFRNIRITRVRIVPVVVRISREQSPAILLHYFKSEHRSFSFIELLVDLISKGGRIVVLRSNEMYAVAIENR